MAKTVTFPINQKPYQNVDPLGLDTLTEEFANGFIDDLGNKNKRQGLSTIAELPGANDIDGLYWWDAQKLVIVVTGGNVFKIINQVGTFVDLTGDKLLPNSRPTFTDNGDTLVIANGGRMVITDGVGLTTFIADADAPTEVTHVAFLDQFILANEVGTGRFHFADFIGAPTVWFAVDVFTAEAAPDAIIALYVNRRTIILAGRESIEFWVNDGISPFIRLQGTTTARGVMGPHATTFANEVGYFFDDRRRFVRLEGTNLTILSTPFDRTIQAFDTVDDILSDYITVEGRHIIVLSFPTEDQTLIYDILGDYWGTWTLFQLSSSTTKRFLGTSYAYARDFNQHLFGSYINSKVMEMKSTFFTDDGNNIIFSVTTGDIDYDAPDRRKRSYKLSMRLKSGVGLPNNQEPLLRFRFKDDGTSQFGNYRFISLKTQGNREFLHTIRNLGSYHTRKWQFIMAEPVAFVIGKSQEIIDVAEF